MRPADLNPGVRVWYTMHMGAPAPTRRDRRGARRSAAAIILGLLSVPLIAMLSGVFLPIRAMSGGVVERDGDHLALWVLRMDFPTGTRGIWFEKGRIYNKQGVGPAGGSSAAVANWSYATGTRSDKRFVKGEVDLPADVRDRIAESPSKVWSIAVDRRGWPWPAMEGRIVGTLDRTSPETYVAETGVLVRPMASVPGLSHIGVSLGGSDSLADVRVLPTKPLWPGLLADAACMTAIWWVALRLCGVMWNAVAARMRGRKGHCSVCGYDLTGLRGGVCPECGRREREPLGTDGHDK